MFSNNDNYDNMDNFFLIDQRSNVVFVVIVVVKYITIVFI